MSEPSERKPSAASPVLPAVAVGLIIGATGWYLLRELTPLLRPLLLAIFLCYVILPPYHGVRSRFPGPVAIAVLGGLTMLVLYLLTIVVQDNVVELREQLPRLTKHAEHLVRDVRTFVKEKIPFLALTAEEQAEADKRRIEQARALITPALNFGANLLIEAGLVAIYVMFILADARRWPNRLRHAFSRDQGEGALEMVRKINDSIVGYFRVQVLVSLMIGVGVTLVMWSTNTSFPVLWGILNFLGNFIPYLGSIVGFTIPVVFGFLDHDGGWAPVVAMILMLVLHLTLAYVVVPLMAGKAVGLSPLVILISLAFWGLCWGVAGMILAVPLTVIVKIVLANVPTTQPLAVMLGDE